MVKDEGLENFVQHVVNLSLFCIIHFLPKYNFIIL